MVDQGMQVEIADGEENSKKFRFVMKYCLNATMELLVLRFRNWAGYNLIKRAFKNRLERLMWRKKC